jgi:DNA invertase Pin-like site-specific DNA recombinase
MAKNKKENIKKYVAYYRVSTKKQEISGLGIDGQKETVKKSIKDGIIIKEFTEIESGKNDVRTQLKEALELCKKEKATLVIAKLDRLSRNVSFIFALKDAGIDFIALDVPGMNTLTLGVLAVIAQNERETISQRTKAALQVKKSQGYKLGNPQNLTVKSREKSIKSRKEKAMAQDYNKIAKAIIEESLDLSLQKIADKLNRYQIKTAKGKEFTACTVQKIIKLYDLKGKKNEVTN